VKDRDVYVNLFLSNSSTLNVGGKKVGITQTTDYPYSDSIRIKIDENRCGEFTLKIRIPGWADSDPVPSDLYAYTVKGEGGFKYQINLGIQGTMNGMSAGSNIRTERYAHTNGNKAKVYVTPDGYLNITRKWEKGDEVTICFEMKPRVVLAHENVEADRGLVAIERGPLVYCAEWADNDFDIKNVVINPEAKFTLGERDLSTFIPEERKAQLSTWASQHITTLSTEAQLVTPDAKGTPQYETVNLTLTPYYTWAHRGRGDMKVWLPVSSEP
jgi:DUF1680 family protein